MKDESLALVDVLPERHPDTASLIPRAFGSVPTEWEAGMFPCQPHAVLVREIEQATKATSYPQV
jgi:hypothetical protein